MQTRGVLVDYRAVNTAMSACAKAQQWSMVLKLYDQVREWLCVCMCACVCARARSDKKRKIKMHQSFLYCRILLFFHNLIWSLSCYSFLSRWSILVLVPLLRSFLFYHYATSSIISSLSSSYTHLSPSSPPSSFLTLHPPPTFSSLPPCLYCALADANSHRSSICS